MRVIFVVQKLYDYGESPIIGVYDTQEGAEQAVREGYKSSKGCSSIHYDWEMWEVT